MFRIVLALIFTFAAMASPAAAHGFDAGMSDASMAAHRGGAQHIQMHGGAVNPMADADQNEGDTPLCHCPAMVCAPTATLAETAPNCFKVDYTMIERRREPDAILAGLTYTADPPPPRI